jgi:hypothetical protein
MSLLSIYKQPHPRGYANGTFLIEDTSQSSPQYFDVTLLPAVMGGGKSVIVLKGNGEGLRFNTEIDVEIVDAAGDNIFCEVVNFIDRFNQYYIAVDIYDIAPRGLATVYLVGKAAIDLQGNVVQPNYRLLRQNINYHPEFDVRWQGSFFVEPSERNNADLLFDKPPVVGVTQVYAPARLQTQSTGSGFIYRTITSSIDELSITTSDFFGYDRDFSTSENILDTRTKNISINPAGLASTINSIDTTIRKKDNDIQGGYRVSQTDRYNTILTSTSSFFRKEYLGGIFEFFSSASTPQDLSPPPLAFAPISGNVADQLQFFNATITDIISDRQAAISKPLVVGTINSSRNGLQSVHQYRQASRFTGSITYAPSDVSYAESVIVSQSYLEFTFTDLKPISGEIYRIKTYTKRGASTGDFKLLNDQIIKPVEYLTDGVFPNTTNYAKHESDYLLIGYFTTQSILEEYWNLYKEVPNSFDLFSGSIGSSVLVESVQLPAEFTESCVFSPKFNQNYTIGQQYSFSFNLTLDPFTEVEVFMSSTPLNYNVLSYGLYPTAFINDRTEDTVRSGSLTFRRNVSPYSPFGKYIGKVVNDSSQRKNYGKVVFDFTTDGSGFGKPLLRSRIIDETPSITGSAYVSELSIKPFKLVGYTPSIVQFAVPLTVELATFFSVISQSLDMKIEYFDYTGRQSEYVTFLDDIVVNLKGEIPSNTCQAETNFFSYSTANTGTTVTRRLIEQQIPRRT